MRDKDGVRNRDATIGVQGERATEATATQATRHDVTVAAQLDHRVRCAGAARSQIQRGRLSDAHATGAELNRTQRGRRSPDVDATRRARLEEDIAVYRQRTGAVLDGAGRIVILDRQRATDRGTTGDDRSSIVVLDRDSAWGRDRDALATEVVGNIRGVQSDISRRDQSR